MMRPANLPGRRTGDESGISLIEMLVAMLIFSILSAAAVAGVITVMERATSPTTVSRTPTTPSR